MRVVIIGGTGTLGQELSKQLLKDHANLIELDNIIDIKGKKAHLDKTLEIVVFSRDELKQQEMKKKFRWDKRLSFVVGDIRDRDALRWLFRRGDIVFHVAALKHIDVIEENPTESIKTNILGTINVCEAAREAMVKTVVFSSTDKAVDPINVYGMCKGISEKLIYHYNTQETQFKVFRWGNVIGSRGSVIHSFADTLIKERTAYITSLDMTRFWIRIEDAVRFIINNYKRPEPLHIPPMKGFPIKDLVAVIANVVGVTRYDICVTGLRPGEKLHEVLTSAHGENCIKSNDCVNHSIDDMTLMVKESLCR